MQERVVAPKTSLTSKELSVTEWYKHEGDAVSAGELIAVLEAEKSTVEIRSPADGVLSAIVAAAGVSVAVGDVLCIIDRAPSEHKT